MKDFQRLLRYLRPHSSIFVLAIFAMILVGFFETATTALIVPIFDQAFNGETGQKSFTLFNLQNLIPADDWYRAWMIISVLLLTFTVCKGIAEFFSSYLMAKIGQ